MDNYTRAVKSGFGQIPEAMQIESLFGEADHFISYNGPTAPQEWNSEVYFGGRYSLTMQVQVETDSAFSKVTKVIGEPTFVLLEASAIDDADLGARFSNQWKFGLKDWKKLYDAKGKFSVIGITVRKDQPLNNFDKYVKAMRAPLVRVRPNSKN